MREEMSDQGSFILIHLKKRVAYAFLSLDRILSYIQNSLIIITKTPYTLAKLYNDIQWQYGKK